MDVTEEVLRIKKSKRDGKPIAYLPDGKVVLISNADSVQVGYGMITSFKEKKNCLVAEVRNVVSDYYPGIGMRELEEVFKLHGFSKEFSEPIDSKNEFSVWANLDGGELITVETWNNYFDSNGSPIEGFNSIQVIVPTTGHVFSDRGHGFSSGGYYTNCFNLVFSKVEFPLFDILSYYSNHSRDWHGDCPYLWHYGDSDREDGRVNFAQALAKIYKFEHRNLGELFNMGLDRAFQSYREHGMIVKEDFNNETLG